MSDQYLSELEAEAIGILREVVAEFVCPLLLFSGGKDSAVLTKLMERAFWPDRVPLPLLHIDTGHNFPEVIQYRDHRAEELGAVLHVSEVQEWIDNGHLESNRAEKGRNHLQTPVLLEAIRLHGADAVIGGARRDEERSRAKERVYSLRDRHGHWNPAAQRPEPWGMLNSFHGADEHIRVFPLSDWTEVDVWHYIARENIELPSLYYAHKRSVVERRGMLMPISSVMPADPEEQVREMEVRFRTVGDMTCTAAVPSAASNAYEVLTETRAFRLSERGATRVDDRVSQYAMEERKRQGYF